MPGNGSERRQRVNSGYFFPDSFPVGSSQIGFVLYPKVVDPLKVAVFTLLHFGVLVAILSSCPFNPKGCNSPLLCDFHKSSPNIYNISLLNPSQIIWVCPLFPAGTLTDSQFFYLDLKAVFPEVLFRDDQSWVCAYQIVGWYTYNVN